MRALLLLWLLGSHALAQTFPFPGPSVIRSGAGGGLGYSYCKVITTLHTMVSGTSDLPNYPLTVILTDTDLKTTGNGGLVHNASGFDIGFGPDCSNTGALLSWEMESYTPSTGAIVAHVKRPTLSHTTDDTIGMYYGGSFSSFQSVASAVWNSNYKGVWHLASLATDSTANNPLTNSNGATTTTGQIDGGAALVTASLQSLYNGSTALPTGGTASTFSLWFKMTNNTPSYQVLGGWGSAGTGNREEVYWDKANNHFNIDFYTTGANVSWTWDGNWHQMVLTNDGTGVIGGTAFYLDGSKITYNSTQGSAINIVAGRVQFGQEPDQAPNTGSNYFGGSLDEARISATNLSAGWILTEYRNQSAPGTYLSEGSRITF